MSKKVILVTGASSGMGYEACKSLASQGHKVYGGARRVEKMESLKADGVTPLKLDVTDSNGSLIQDNDERMMFFTRGVLETIKKLAWKPDIIHCSGWFSMLVPFYVKRTEFRNNPFFMESKLALTLYNDDFGEMLATNMAKKMKADGGTQKDWRFYKEPTYLNIMKAAINYSDAVILASDKVNPELIDFAKQNNKDIVEYTPDNKEFCEKINEYYDSIIEIEED